MAKKVWSKKPMAFDKAEHRIGYHRIMYGEHDALLEFASGLLTSIGEKLKIAFLPSINPLLKVTIVERDYKLTYEMVSVFIGAGHAPYGIFIQTDQPAHRPNVCVEQISVKDSLQWSEDFVDCSHSLIYEIVMRVACCIFGQAAPDDFSAYGVTTADSNGEWSNLYLSIEAEVDKGTWVGMWYGPSPAVAGHPVTDYITALDNILFGLWTTDDNGRTVLDDLKEGASASLADDLGYSDTTEYKVNPVWKERSPITVFRAGKGSSKKSAFWVEETRCKICGQRIIIHLGKDKCSDGIPDTKVKCSGCQNLFQFH